MNHEHYLTLDLVARLAGRFGPARRVAKELPSWLEYLTGVKCPERPPTHPDAIWWEKVRHISRDLVPVSGEGRKRDSEPELCHSRRALGSLGG